MIATAAESWVSIPHPKPAARVRLLCFPCAGGGASAYFSWSKALADQPIEVASIQLPGRESRIRESPYVDLDALVESLGFAIESNADRPLAFFGHSMGALLVFELTRWLRDRGRALPLHVFVAGARAPQLPRTEPALHAISGDDAFLDAVARRYGGIPRAVMASREFRELVAPALRADLRMNEAYRYRAAGPLPVSISAYGGDEDPSVREDWLIQWREQTSATFAHRMFRGDHFFLNDARDLVLADITSQLASSFPAPLR